MLNSSQQFRTLLRPPSLSKDGTRARWQAWLNPISHLTSYLLCLLTILWATSAHAATTINVTTQNMAVAADGGCGLTEALQAARTNLAVNECAVGGGAPFTINLQPNETYTATTIGNTDNNWGNSAFVVNNPVVINGNGSTINQSGQLMRIFLVFNTLTIRNATISGGAPDGPQAFATLGGGFLVAFGGNVLNLEDVTVANNHVPFDGAAMFVIATAVANLHRSSITNNTSSAANGGQIRVSQATARINLANTTFSGIRALNISDTGVLSAANVTISASAAIISDATATVSVQNSILGGACNLGGTVTSTNNSSSNASCIPARALPPLGALADNGGSTRTILPVLPNASKDAATGCTYLSTGTNPLFTNGAAITTDQRGFARDAACDVGAVESLTIAPASLPSAIFNDTYAQTITQAGGANPTTYAVAIGALPTGLTLANGGGISGTATAAGTFNFVITATDANGFATSMAYTIVINKAAQAITFGAAPTIAVNGTGTVSATGSGSPNPVVFTSMTTGICTVSGTTVTGVTAGLCIIAANQASNLNYNAAPQVTQNITINKAAQTINFGAVPTVNFNASGMVSAAGGASGNPVTFTSATTGVCTALGANGSIVTGVSVGTCTIRANQTGNANYNAAPQVTQDIIINKAPQTITFAATPASLFTNAAPFTVTATGGASGNTVTFTTTTPLICSANGSLITLTQQSGTCTIRANQLGNGNYLDAPLVERSITIGFEPPPPPPTAPTNLACAASVVIAGRGTIDCSFKPSTSESSRNPIQSYRLYCANDTANTAVQMTVAASQARAAIANAPVGRYTCNVAAQGTTSASQSSNLVRVMLSATLLALSNQFDADGKGFATILVRGSTSPTTEASQLKAATNTTQIGRFDGTKFNFTAATDMGDGWNVLGQGDLTGSNRSSVIGRNAGDDVRVDAGLLGNIVSTNLRKAKSDWSLETVTDLDGDGKADMVWRYMKPGTNDSGVIFAWYMNSEPMLNVAEVKHRGGAPLSWSLIGATDIDGDGRGDLIWLSPTNEIRSLTSKLNRTWMNERIGQLPTGYSIQKLADFNGDGKGDILFKDAQGNVKVWLMDGTRIVFDSIVGNVAANTTFYAAGDFDGDGAMDIVWKKADGTLTLWLMNKTIINQPTIIDNVGQAPAGSVVVE